MLKCKTSHKVIDNRRVLALSHLLCCPNNSYGKVGIIFSRSQLNLRSNISLILPLYLSKFYSDRLGDTSIKTLNLTAPLSNRYPERS